MPIMLFLLDTSASMNQRTEMGTTYLDVAKNAVEVFLKLRSRDPSSRADRYMLVTSEDPPYCIKAGWKESHATFMTELKNLHASGLTTLGQALKSAFDLLNLNRLVSGIDNYGQGRNPFFLEPALLIAITDGNKLTCPTGVLDELHLPLTSPLPGSELTKEPFRWDQRLFALVLRIPGTYSPDPEPLGSIPMDDSVITQLCEITGGRSYCVRSPKMLSQCLESLVQKVQIGVVVNFEKAEAEPVLLTEDIKRKKDTPCDTPKSLTSSDQQQWHSSRKLIYVRANPKTGVPVGHWPIPESFWPDQNSPTLPPRTAHPTIRFLCVDCEPMVIDKLPFDKYELEDSPLTQHILERKSPVTCWQVFVANSGKHSDMQHPFGYLKASTSLTCVNLFVLPYNYPVLLPLLDELFKVHKLNPSPKWQQDFDEYLKYMPSYFLSPLKKALRSMGASNVVIESVESGLSYSVIAYLKKLNQQSKVEAEKRNALVGKKPPTETGIKLKTFSIISNADFHSHLKPLTSGSAHISLIELNGKEEPTFELAIPKKGVKPHLYKNPFDIPRSCLLDQLTRMRANLLNTFTNVVGQNEDSSHSIPIMQMGNYQEYLKTAPPPLREIDSEQPKRLHGFGNPFKQDKKGMMIDEADEFMTRPQHKMKRSGDHHSMGSSRKRRSLSPSTSKKSHTSSGKAALASRSFANLSRSSASPSRSSSSLSRSSASPSRSSSSSSRSSGSSSRPSGSSSRSSGSPSRSLGPPSRSPTSPTRPFSSRALLSRAYSSRAFPSVISSASMASASQASASVTLASMASVASMASTVSASEASASVTLASMASVASTVSASEASASVALASMASVASTVLASEASASVALASMASMASMASTVSASEASASVALASMASVVSTVSASEASASVALASVAPTASEASASMALASMASVASMASMASTSEASTSMALASTSGASASEAPSASTSSSSSSAGLKRPVPLYKGLKNEF
ncbi:integrator complex subunit 6 isoform X2 [Sarcophilus harrisii]|uniref:integrator complex subunit 6 isoform X2 n=1 Tax=Sarcophilus harrisii TaxID=9305 RepID=UPI001301D275|nr:integrator complex subunit 6 isoform X2 [Sarcophilus harrisii]